MADLLRRAVEQIEQPPDEAQNDHGIVVSRKDDRRLTLPPIAA